MSKTLTPLRSSESDRRIWRRVSIDFGWRPSALPVKVRFGLLSMMSTLMPKRARLSLDGTLALASARGELDARKHQAGWAGADDQHIAGGGTVEAMVTI